MTQNAVNITKRLVQRLSTSVGTLITCSTVIPADNTIPQNTEGTQILTLTITPTTSTSTLVIDFSSPITTSSSATNGPTVALFQDSTVNALAAQCLISNPLRSVGGVLRYEMTSGTTSATTFKIRVGPGSDSCFVNGDTAGAQRDGGVSNTNLTISEYI